MIRRFSFLIGRRIVAGKKLKIRGRVKIKGPGRLIIGDSVEITGTANSVCTPWTSTKSSQIKIGSNVFLNGTRFSCRDSISIGDDCIIGDARISDNDGHSVNVNRRSLPDSEIPTKPVVINKNVWIGAGVYILKGVTIGENSVIGAASVVYKDIPENVVAAGNPCRVIKEISRKSSVI